MAGASNLRRSSSNSRAALLCNGSGKATEVGGSTGEATLRREMEALRVSKHLVTTVTQKLKTKRKRKKIKSTRGGGGGGGEEMVGGGRGSSSRCLSRYVRGGGCRVGDCQEFDGDGRRRPSAVAASEECVPRGALLVAEKAGVECFSYRERSSKKSPGKAAKGAEQCPPSSAALPDDVLEMILVRLPLPALMAARCVCRKWRCMAAEPHFLQLRSEGPCRNPWLFLFGVTKDGHHVGEVQALDVSLDRWHRISHSGLKGRSFVSVAAIDSDLYIVGGRTCIATSSAPLERSNFKALKGVLVFSPLSTLWRKAAPMKSARSAPVLGVFEVGPCCSIFRCRPDRQEKIQLKSRFGGVSDVYEDPHRFSLRRQLRDAFDEADGSPESRRKPSKPAGQRRENRSKFALIAVGGRGSCDETLDSGEVYDPMTNKWVETARLPEDFGAVCSGAVCRGMFYVYSEADRLAGFDLERGFWVTIQTSGPPPALRQFHPRLVSCRGRLFLLCVSWHERDRRINRREKAVRKLWELDTALYAWSEVSRHPDAPMDGNAAFVADGDRIYGVEMFRIFGQVLDFLTACHISDTELRWTRVSRKHAVHEADASSCATKSMAVLHL